MRLVHPGKFRAAASKRGFVSMPQQEIFTIQSIADSLMHSCQMQSAFTQQKTDALIKQLYSNLLPYAKNLNASDIHIEPTKHCSKIRTRIDGVLQPVVEIPLPAHEQLISKIKILSNLDIAQNRMPQDGKINHDELSLQLRTSTCPTIHGEKAVLRLLKNKSSSLEIDKLNMPIKTQRDFVKSIKSPQGLILITGPTGSGKTVTLYSALNYLNNQEKNIVTIEDPVEIYLPGINQTAVNNKSGLSFSTALRAFLRQDPDIIMIGEIRDKATAEIALEAAHTGHLVFATLHTNSCLDVVARLEQLGADYYTLITSLKMIISQRLLRKIDRQHVSGYSGRIAIFEHLYFNRELQKIALSDKNSIANGKIPNYLSLREQASYYIDNNMTDLAEINRVLGFGSSHEI